LKDKVIDGTKCGKFGFHICVNGMCRRGGCDNILDSNKQFGKFFNLPRTYTNKMMVFKAKAMIILLKKLKIDKTPLNNYD